MSEYKTVFGSLNNFEKGKLEIINDNPKYYAYSNVFDVASKSDPYEKVVVAKNLEYVIEAVRAEGESCWFASSHDEFAIVMDGEIKVDFVKLDDAESIAPSNKEGSVVLEGKPKGKNMGYVIAGHGHQVLLPKGAAYKITATKVGVFLIQTIFGENSVEKWADICYM